MAKARTAFVCNECGADFSKWQGQCPECGAWNTLTEYRIAGKQQDSRNGAAGGFAGEKPRVEKLANVSVADLPRIVTGIGELDRVLGGGLVPGSVVLIGGSPGAGKSTLLLQATCGLASRCTTLYVTGEESLQQVAMRARRLSLPEDDLHILAETNVESVGQMAQQLGARLLVVDSVQVMHMTGIESAPGSVSQVRECAAWLTRLAKQSGTVVLLVGHVTKEGHLAGPKVLEHMIDCSLLLEGESDNRFRILRSMKNRFGAVNELGIFAMLEQGLREVKNPSAIFLNRSEQEASGSVVTVIWEGTRPLLIEIQALVDDSQLGNPRRVSVGMDNNRMAMLLAVLHRHAGIFVGDKDVFANVVGGVRVTETSADLALLCAVISSLRDRPLPQDMVVFGEVGLSGEIRPVPNGQERLNEAVKHGFTKAIVPAGNVPREPVPGLHVTAVKKLSDALDVL